MIDSALAATFELAFEPIGHDQVVSGSPNTGVAELGNFDGRSWGVWEMTPGTMSDVEEDELFIVLSGRASVEFLDSAETLELVAGVVVTLVAGMRTVWTVTETLRKVWIAGA